MATHSKATYILIAAEIQQTSMTAKRVNHDHPVIATAAVTALADLANRLALRFGNENPEFKKDAFLKACGFGGK